MIDLLTFVILKMPDCPDKSMRKIEELALYTPEGKRVYHVELRAILDGLSDEAVNGVIPDSLSCSKTDIERWAQR